MLGFSKKQDETKPKNEIIDDIINRISLLRGDIAALRSDFEALRTNLNSLNGRINRKFNPIEEAKEIKGEFPFSYGGGA